MKSILIAGLIFFHTLVFAQTKKDTARHVELKEVIIRSWQHSETPYYIRLRT